MALTKADRKWLRKFKTKIKHAKKALLGSGRKKTKKRSSRRDPAWYGQPRRHAKAAKKGHRKAKRARRDPALYRSPLLGRGRGARRASAVHPWYVMRDPAWYGESKRHAKAAKKGHRKAKRKGRRDPALYRSPLLKGHRGKARTSAVHPWYGPR